MKTLHSQCRGSRFKPGQGTRSHMLPLTVRVLHLNMSRANQNHNLTHDQRNANQDHTEVPSHASQNGCNPKVYKQYMLERVWRKENPLTLLVGMQTSTATRRTVWQFLKQLEIELPYDPAIPLLGIHTKETRIERDMPNVHHSTVYNSQDMEAT